LKLLAPFGCAFQTGSGSVLRLGGLKPYENVLVVGLGGVGLSAVMAAAMATTSREGRRRHIIGVDRVESRLQLALKLGATSVINTSIHPKFAAEVSRITEGFGAVVTADTTGDVEVIDEAIKATATMGRVVLIGIAKPDSEVKVIANEFIQSGKSIIGSIEGDADPETYIPEMITWYKNKKFPVNELVKFYAAADFKQALYDMHTGEVIKPVLVW